MMRKRNDAQMGLHPVYLRDGVVQPSTVLHEHRGVRAGVERGYVAEVLDVPDEGVDLGRVEVRPELGAEDGERAVEVDEGVGGSSWFTKQAKARRRSVNSICGVSFI